LLVRQLFVQVAAHISKQAGDPGIPLRSGLARASSSYVCGSIRHEPEHSRNNPQANAGPTLPRCPEFETHPSCAVEEVRTRAMTA